MHAPARHNRVLASIAIYKYVKAVLVVTAGLGLLRLLDPEVMSKAEDFVAAIASPFIRSRLEHLLGRAGDLSPGHLKALGIGALFYAGLYVVEGTGLWLEKVWAEYLTVIATASFIPFECWELSHKISPFRLGAFAINVVIVIVLIHMLRVQRQRRAATAVPT